MFCSCLISPSLLQNDVPSFTCIAKAYVFFSFLLAKAGILVLILTCSDSFRSALVNCLAAVVGRVIGDRVEVEDCKTAVGIEDEVALTASQLHNHHHNLDLDP